MIFYIAKYFNGEWKYETMKYVEWFNNTIIAIIKKRNEKCLCYSNDELTYETIKYVKCLSITKMETLT